MMVLATPKLRRLALAVLDGLRGDVPGTDALAAAATRTHADLVRVAVPLLGHAGIAALMGRAVHLAQREHPLLRRISEPADADRAFDDFIACLQGQDPAVATDAAATVFATFFGLLVDLIGEPLTTGLLRKAWPDAVSDANN